MIRLNTNGISYNLDCDCTKGKSQCKDGEWWQKCEKCNEQEKLGECKGCNTINTIIDIFWIYNLNHERSQITAYSFFSQKFQVY